MQIIRIFLAALLSTAINAQELPVMIKVPPLHADPNVRFEVMHFGSPEKDKFSVLSLYHVSGSVLAPGEFVQDTGQIVFQDNKWKDPILNSSGAVLIKRQLVDINGVELSSEEHLLALRKLEPGSNYRLYFRKNVKDPVLSNRTTVNKSVYNAQQLPNMSAEEQTVFVNFCAQYIPKDDTEKPKQVQNQHTIVDDYNEMKRQFTAIQEARRSFRGDIPSNEKVQTRFTISGPRSFVVTKSKGNAVYLKFYLSDDDKVFTCLDSAKVEGDVLVTSVAVAYNMNAEAVGAFTNFHYKFKDEKGEEVSRQYSFVMDPEFKIHGWVHSTGKDKLNSLAAEMCWFEDKKFYLLSDNRERVFKTYAQVHEFTLGGESKLLFPANEEEKGTEKTKFVGTFQPPAPFNSSQVTPIPEKYVPLNTILSGNTKYFLAQGVKYNDAIKANEYLSVKIYRFEPGGRLTNIDILGDYRSPKPFPLTQIAKYEKGEYFLLEYPIRVQLLYTPEKATLSALTDDSHHLVQSSGGGLIQRSAHGSMMLKKEAIGNKMQFLYYPN